MLARFARMRKTRYYTNVNLGELKTLMTIETCVLVDVRGTEEVASTGKLAFASITAHTVPLPELDGALAMPGGDFLDKYGFAKPTKDVDVVFTCRSGRRSASAAVIAEARGWTRVRNYTGGANEWFEEFDTVL